MPNKLPLMKLSHDEERFLRHWMHDEARYEQGPGPAKRMQLQQGATPAELSVIIAAAIPDPTQQETMALAPPSEEPLRWPWPGKALQSRVAEARSVLAGSAPGHATRSVSADPVLNGRDNS